MSNLPTTKTATVLKARLTKLSDNCGGKVVAINGNKAIVRFPNTEAAFRYDLLSSFVWFPFGRNHVKVVDVIEC